MIRIRASEPLTTDEACRVSSPVSTRRICCRVQATLFGMWASLVGRVARRRRSKVSRQSPGRRAACARRVSRRAKCEDWKRTASGKGERVYAHLHKGRQASMRTVAPWAAYVVPSVGGWEEGRSVPRAAFVGSAVRALVHRVVLAATSPRSSGGHATPLRVHCKSIRRRRRRRHLDTQRNCHILDLYKGLSGFKSINAIAIQGPD